jgi:hypothetical protein
MYVFCYVHGLNLEMVKPFERAVLLFNSTNN